MKWFLNNMRCIIDGEMNSCNKKIQYQFSQESNEILFGFSEGFDCFCISVSLSIH